jgi:hypothetical protein
VSQRGICEPSGVRLLAEIEVISKRLARVHDDGFAVAFPDMPVMMNSA